MSAFRSVHGASLLFIIPATIVLVLVLVLGPQTGQVQAADVFGSLRAPGEVAFVAGHRGDGSAAPENTMPAFDRALESSIDFVETDVQLTKDGVPVLFHDVRLDRTTNGRGTVAEHTMEQLRKLDAGSWYGEAYAGTRIPTLDTFLARLATSDKKALVELKFSWTAAELRPIITLIDQHALRDRVVLQSFSLETLANLQRVAARYPRMMLVRELPADPVPMARQFGVIALATTAVAVAKSPEAVVRLHEAGIGVVCYTLNSQKQWSEAQGHGVDGIITDTPGDLDSWLADGAPAT
ncbi:MAG: glycerophosphodiester phosphodiesterase family protein [Cryobacterium sp.]